MARNIESRPGAQWLGLVTTNAPMNLPEGSLTAARDVVIRQGSILEQRVGVGQYLPRGVDINGTTALWSTVALASKSTEVGDDIFNPQTLTSVLAIAKNPSTGNHYLCDTDSGKSSYFRRNYWGYPVFSAATGTAYARYDDPQGTVVGDSRVVDGIYTTHSTPGEILKTPKGYAEYEPTSGDTNMGYNVYGRALGTPSVAYTEVSVLNSNDIGYLWADNTVINTVSYRSAFKLNDRRGAPSERAFVVTPLLPKIASITRNSNNLGTATVTFADVHGFTAIGNLFNLVSVAGADNAARYQGIYAITQIISTTVITIAVDPTIALPADSTKGVQFTGVPNWKRALKTVCRVYRPKEQAYSSHYLGTLLGVDAATVALRHGNLHNRVIFQDGELELYRTNVASWTPEVGAQDPGDEHFLVSNVKADFRSALANGWSATVNRLYLEYTDLRAEGDLDDFLYTNPSQESVAGTNFMPPIARVHEVYNGYHFWGNVRDKAVAAFQITRPLTAPIVLVTKSSRPRSDGATVAYVLTPASATPVFANWEFSTGVGAINTIRVEEQARSLVRLINARPELPLKARYVSGFGEGAGKIEIVYLDYQAEDMYVFSDDLNTDKLDTKQDIKPVTVDVSNSGVVPSSKASVVNAQTKAIAVGATVNADRFYWSKYQLPYSTPAQNFLKTITGGDILALRATSEGIYIVTTKGVELVSGTSDDTWSHTVRDYTAACWSQGATQSLKDNLIILTDQGVQVYADGRVISLPINNLVQNARKYISNTSVLWDEVDEPYISSAIDPSNSEYMLMLPTDRVDGRHMLRYNLISNTWTVTERSFTAGLYYTANDFNRMIFADDTHHHIVAERDALDPLVHSDESYVLPRSAIVSQRQLADGTWQLRGHLIPAKLNDEANGKLSENDFVAIVNTRAEDGSFLKYDSVRILSVRKDPDDDVWVFVLDQHVPVEEGEDVTSFVTVFTVRSEIGLLPYRGGDANVTKRWGEIQVHLLDSVTRELEMETSTEQRRTPQLTRVVSTCDEDGFGSYGFGEARFGNETENAEPILRTYVPQPQNVGTNLWLTLRNTGFNQTVRLQSVGIVHSALSTRTGR